MRKRTAEEEWVHPECGRYEVFFGTMSERSFAALPFRTKRHGTGRWGRVPVFIHVEELQHIGENQVDLLTTLKAVWGRAYAH